MALQPMPAEIFDAICQEFADESRISLADAIFLLIKLNMNGGFDPAALD